MEQAYEITQTIKWVLLVERNTAASAALVQQLRENHCLVVQAYSCARAMALIKFYHYDLILLDEQLPNMDISAFCGAARAQYACPIIFISDHDDSSHVIAALQSGGDDYMLRPIHCEELLARAQAIRRRLCKEEDTSDNPKNFRSFTMDLTHRTVSRKGQMIDLTPIEYSLLLYFTQHPDTLLLYHDLYKQVWNCDSLGDTRTIMVHISNLRKKLDPEHEGLIRTVRGVGYIFSDC